jgi:hypothetical protein
MVGGWMVMAVKHGLPRMVMTNSPFYITTNEVPNFGEDDENVKRRIVVFNTTSLPTTTPGADCWMYTNAIHCIAWLANKITTFRRHVDPEEPGMTKRKRRRHTSCLILLGEK